MSLCPVVLPLIAGLISLTVPVVQASDISFLNSFGNIAYEQTGNGNTLTLNGTFFSADVNTSVPNPYTSVSMTFPGAMSPITSFSQLSPTDYHYQTGLYSTLAAMHTDFPTGTYTFTANNGDAASYNYTADDYSASLPYLTGTNYTDLQGMNSAQPFNFTFSPFTTGSTATDSFIFFTIFDDTLGKSVFDAGFLPATTTGVTLPGGALHPGDLFSYELDFSNRDVLTTGFTGGGGPPQLGFDVRADGTFTTAAAAATPEPSSAALLGLGLLAAACRRLVRRRGVI
jgi:hypothetical protein